MIRRLGDADFQTILFVVNEAAVVYRGKIPDDCYKIPYMQKKELEQEIGSDVQFYGYIENGEVVSVMGIQPVGDATLIRHAYTITSYQRQGIGAKLLNYLLTLAETRRILVGTWELASWAIRFYQNHGFQLTTRQETNRLLRKYWNIPQRQVETSVVLTLDRNAQ
jgi:GNAT superfamily N-acetyltransferase